MPRFLPDWLFSLEALNRKLVTVSKGFDSESVGENVIYWSVLVWLSLMYSASQSSFFLVPGSIYLKLLGLKCLVLSWLKMKKMFTKRIDLSFQSVLCLLILPA